MFEPRGTLRMEVLGGGATADIEDGASLPEDSLVVFFTRAQGSDYLYLLQRSNGSRAIFRLEHARATHQHMCTSFRETVRIAGLQNN